MSIRRVYMGGVAAIVLAVAACDGGVAFPGFDEKPSENTVPPPPEVDPAPISEPDDNAETPETPVETPPTNNDTDTDLTPEDPVAPETPEVDEPADPDPTTTDPTETDPDTDPETDPETGTADPVTDIDDTPETPTDASDNDPATEDPEPSDPETPADPVDTDTETDTPPEEDPTPDAPETPPVEPAFSYHAAGALTAGSGLGATDETVYAPDMVFPIKDAPAFPQSMVFRPGGFRYEGDLPGDECIPENYEYPWEDNFCERGRPSSFKSESCPAGSGVHLGQDIRVGDGPTCEAMRRRYRNDPQSITDYKVVAAEDGVISGISTYTVTLRAGPRTYRYLHMNMRALQVSIGDEVNAGQHLGYVSKDFGSTSTTFHLHFVLKVNNGSGSVFVPPYTSLVESYARREGAPGERIERNVNIAFDAVTWDPNEVFENIE